MRNTTEELGMAALDVFGETANNPMRVALALHEGLARNGDPHEVVRRLIVDILDGLEVEWDRAEDAPGWLDDDESEDDEEDDDE